MRSSLLILALVAATATTTELIKEIAFPKLEGNSTGAVTWPVGPNTTGHALQSSAGSVIPLGQN